MKGETMRHDDLSSSRSGQTRVNVHLDRCKSLLQKIQQEIDAEESFFAQTTETDARDERQEGFKSERSQENLAEARLGSERDGNDDDSPASPDLDRILASFDWSIPEVSKELQEADQKSLSSKRSTKSMKSIFSLKINANHLADDQREMPAAENVDDNREELSLFTATTDDHYDNDSPGSLIKNKNKKTGVRRPPFMNRIKRMALGRAKTSSDKEQLVDGHTKNELTIGSELDKGAQLKTSAWQEVADKSLKPDTFRSHGCEKTSNLRDVATTERDVTQAATLLLKARTNPQVSTQPNEDTVFAVLEPHFQIVGLTDASSLTEVPSGENINRKTDDSLGNKATPEKEKWKAKKKTLAKLKHHFQQKQPGGTSLGELFDKLGEDWSDEAYAEVLEAVLAVLKNHEKTSRLKGASTSKQHQPRANGNSTRKNAQADLQGDSESLDMDIPGVEKQLSFTDKIYEFMSLSPNGKTEPPERVANVPENGTPQVSKDVTPPKSMLSPSTSHVNDVHDENLPYHDKNLQALDDSIQDDRGAKIIYAKEDLGNITERDRGEDEHANGIQDGDKMESSDGKEDTNKIENKEMTKDGDDVEGENKGKLNGELQMDGKPSLSTMKDDDGSQAMTAARRQKIPIELALMNCNESTVKVHSSMYEPIKAGKSAPPREKKGATKTRHEEDTSNRKAKTSTASVALRSSSKRNKSAILHSKTMDEAETRETIVQAIQESSSSPREPQPEGYRTVSSSVKLKTTNAPSREDPKVKDKPIIRDVRYSVEQSVRQFDAKMSSRSRPSRQGKKSSKRSARKASQPTKASRQSQREKAIGATKPDQDMNASQSQLKKVERATKLDEDQKASQPSQDGVAKHTTTNPKIEMSARKMLSWAKDAEDNELKPSHMETMGDEALAPSTIWWSNSMEAVEVLIDAEDDASDNGTVVTVNTEVTEHQINFSFSGLKEATGVLVEEVQYVGKDVLKDLATDVVKEGQALVKEWFTGGKSKTKKKRRT